MSWPQNPPHPQNAQQPQQPPQQPGFGPPPAWTPTVAQPQYTAPGPHTAYGQQGPSQPHQQPLPQQPPEQPGSRRGMYAAVGGVVALALLGGVVTFALMGDDKKSGGAKASSSPSASASSSSSARTSPVPTEIADPASPQPMIAGWQTQSRDTHHFQYDVPPKSGHWQVFSPDTTIAYTGADGKPIVAMSGTANYREGGCASSAGPDAVGTAGKGQLATIGTQGGGKEPDVRESARNAAGNWGFAAYGGPDHKPKIEVSPATPWKHNGIDGYTATATITRIHRPSPCVPATATARSIAQRLKDGTVHEWVIYADQGVPNALTTDEIEKIMSTVRPTTGY